MSVANSVFPDRTEMRPIRKWGASLATATIIAMLREVTAIAEPACAIAWKDTEAMIAASAVRDTTETHCTEKYSDKN